MFIDFGNQLAIETELSEPVGVRDCIMSVSVCVCVCGFVRVPVRPPSNLGRVSQIPVTTRRGLRIV